MAPAAGNDDGTDLIYGIHAVREALRARSRPVSRLLVAGKDRQFAELVQLARSAHVPVHVEPRPALDRLVAHGRHQGVIAEIAAKSAVEPEEILAHARREQTPPFVVIVDGVEDPQNLGAILRTAEAAGVHGVILPDRRSVGLTGAVAKASAGAIDHLSIARVPNLSRLIEWLQQEGVWVYGLDPSALKPYTSLDLRGAVAFVLGSEGRGVRPGVLEKCDERVSIPMGGRVGSLNVSTAAAIALYEVVRQRTRSEEPRNS